MKPKTLLAQPDPYNSMKELIAYVEQDQKDQKKRAWSLFDADQARRERIRLINSGVIIPANRMRPTPVVKRTDGTWAIGIETFL